MRDTSQICLPGLRVIPVMYSAGNGKISLHFWSSASDNHKISTLVAFCDIFVVCREIFNCKTYALAYDTM